VQRPLLTFRPKKCKKVCQDGDRGGQKERRVQAEHFPRAHPYARNYCGIEGEEHDGADEPAEIRQKMGHGLAFYRQREISAQKPGENLAGCLYGALCPSLLLNTEGRKSHWQFRQHAIVVTVDESPAGHLGPVAQVQVLCHRVRPPPTGAFNGIPPPHPRRAVEIEKKPFRITHLVLDGEMRTQQQRLYSGQKRMFGVAESPSGLDHTHFRVREAGDRLAQKVPPWGEVRVEDGDELPFCGRQPLGQRSRLVTMAV